MPPQSGKKAGSDVDFCRYDRRSLPEERQFLPLFRLPFAILALIPEIPSEAFRFPTSFSAAMWPLRGAKVAAFGAKMATMRARSDHWRCRGSAERARSSVFPPRHRASRLPETGIFGGREQRAVPPGHIKKARPASDFFRNGPRLYGRCYEFMREAGAFRMVGMRKPGLPIASSAIPAVR